MTQNQVLLLPYFSRSERRDLETTPLVYHETRPQKDLLDAGTVEEVSKLNLVPAS